MPAPCRTSLHDERRPPARICPKMARRAQAGRRANERTTIAFLFVAPSRGCGGGGKRPAYCGGYPRGEPSRRRIQQRLRDRAANAACPRRATGRRAGSSIAAGSGAFRIGQCRFVQQNERLKTMSSKDGRVATLVTAMVIFFEKENPLIREKRISKMVGWTGLEPEKGEESSSPAANRR